MTGRLISNQVKTAAKIVIAKGDSAASGHYWQEKDVKVLSKIKDIIGPSVLLPNEDTVDVTSQGQLPLSPLFSSRAKKAIILPGLKSASLISIGQLCDDNCTVLLNKRKLLAIKEKQVILEGSRNYSDGLWDITIYKTNIQDSNYFTPKIHLSIYPSRNEEAINCIITNNKQIYQKSEEFKLPPEFQRFNRLIDDNINNMYIDNQMRKDASTYAPVTI